jgi:hypothetical protein
LTDPLLQLLLLGALMKTESVNVISIVAVELPSTSSASAFVDQLAFEAKVQTVFGRQVLVEIFGELYAVDFARSRRRRRRFDG